MQFRGKEGEYLLALTLQELTTLHKALWNDLKARGALGIDEEASDLLHDLQTLLQKEAVRLGVDISIHSEWARFAQLDGMNCRIDRS